MVAELELQDYQVKVGYLGFMNHSFICVQLIKFEKTLAYVRQAKKPVGN